MSVKSTAARLIGTIFFRIKSVIHNDLDLERLKRKYNADGSTVVEVRIFEDRAMSRFIMSQRYRIEDDTINVTDREANAVVLMSYGTMINLVRGKITRISPKGEKYVEQYDFMDAYSDSDIHIIRTNVDDNERYLADIQLFQSLYKEVLPKIRDMIGER